jgi:hypothetical protein
MSVGYLRGCANKRRHENQESANQHRRALVRIGVYTMSGSNEYKCKQCDFWHVGRTGRKRRKR